MPYAKICAWRLYYLVIGGVMFFIMYVWFKARKIKNRYVEFVRLEHYIPKIQELSNDRSVPKYATHLGVPNKCR